MTRSTRAALRRAAAARDRAAAPADPDLLGGGDVAPPASPPRAAPPSPRGPSPPPSPRSREETASRDRASPRAVAGDAPGGGGDDDDEAWELAAAAMHLARSLDAAAAAPAQTGPRRLDGARGRRPRSAPAKRPAARPRSRSRRREPLPFDPPSPPRPRGARRPAPAPRRDPFAAKAASASLDDARALLRRIERAEARRRPAAKPRWRAPDPTPLAPPPPLWSSTHLEPAETRCLRYDRALHEPCLLGGASRRVLSGKY